MIDIDVTDRSEQRKFGLTLAVAFAALGAVRWWWKGETTGVLFVLGGLLLVFGLVAPRALQPLFRAWIKFAEILNAVMTRLLLGAVFLAMIVPGRIVLTLLGKDPLHRQRLPDAETYWEEPEEQPEDPKRYLEQY